MLYLELLEYVFIHIPSVLLLLLVMFVFCLNHRFALIHYVVPEIEQGNSQQTMSKQKIWKTSTLLVSCSAKYRSYLAIATTILWNRGSQQEK